MYVLQQLNNWGRGELNCYAFTTKYEDGLNLGVFD